VLLAPVSFNQGIPESLEKGVDVVREEMAVQLRARGVSVGAPTLAEFHDVWIAATREIGTLYDADGVFDEARFDAASRAMIEAYTARGEQFDVLLLSYFEIRTATVRGGRASWDGVKRLPILDLGNGKREPTPFPHLWQMPGVSLRVVAFANDGARLFEERGGLEVAIEYFAGLRSRPRQDLFQDASAVQEGVAIALAPLFPD
jgi:hypothetical protein